MKQPDRSARKLDIVLQSAAGLKKVNASRMAAYAVAWIEPSLRVPSPKDSRHGRNPVWDTTISMTLNERVLSQAAAGTQRLHIELLGQGLVSTTPIGFVSVDLANILSQGFNGAAVRAPFPEHPVRRRSGRQQGVLNFELCLQASPTHITPPADAIGDLQPDNSDQFADDSGPSELPSSSSQHQLRRELGVETTQLRQRGSGNKVRAKDLRYSTSREDGIVRSSTKGEIQEMGYHASRSAPVPKSNSRVDTDDQHEETSLLESFDRAMSVASH